MSTPMPATRSVPAWDPEIALDALASARQAAAGPCKAAQPDLAVVRIEGPDAREFLHGQLAADIAGLAAGRGVLTAWCSAQGRVLFLLRVCAAVDHFDLVLPRAQAMTLVQRLRLFVLRARVSIAETDALVFGLVPADGADRPAPDTAPDTARDADGVTLLGVAGARPRCLVFGPPAALVSCWNARPEPAVRPAAWTLLDIEAGIPSFAPMLADQCLPQHLNLDAGPGISFTKGCYPGQEVIARLKYRGQVKSRLMCGTLAAAVAIEPGTKLYAPGDGSGNTIGMVVAGAPDATGGSAVLAVVEFERVRSAPAALGAPDGPAVQFRPAPGWPA